MTENIFTINDANNSLIIKRGNFSSHRAGANDAFSRAIDRMEDLLANTPLEGTYDIDYRVMPTHPGMDTATYQDDDPNHYVEVRFSDPIDRDTIFNANIFTT